MIAPWTFSLKEMLVHLIECLDGIGYCNLSMRSNETFFDFPFPDDNLLTIKGLDTEHANVPI